MCFEFRQVDDYVGLEDLPRNQVTVTPRRVGLCHQPRVITGDTKRGVLIGYRLQQTVAGKIEKNKLIFRLHVLVSYPHSINEGGDSTPKIANTFESRFARLKLLGPVVQLSIPKQQLKVAAL
jgi:hypothetical protein